MKTLTGPQFGTIVTGDIGHARRLEFDITGDIINVATQLEQLSHEFKVSIVASNNFSATARQSDKFIRFLFAALKRGASQTIHRRDANIDVWTLLVV